MPENDIVQIRAVADFIGILYASQE